MKNLIFFPIIFSILFLPIMDKSEQRAVLVAQFNAKLAELNQLQANNAEAFTEKQKENTNQLNLAGKQLNKPKKGKETTTTTKEDPNDIDKKTFLAKAKEHLNELQNSLKGFSGDKRPTNSKLLHWALDNKAFAGNKLPIGIMVKQIFESVISDTLTTIGEAASKFDLALNFNNPTFLGGQYEKFKAAYQLKDDNPNPDQNKALWDTHFNNAIPKTAIFLESAVATEQPKAEGVSKEFKDWMQEKQTAVINVLETRPTKTEIGMEVNFILLEQYLYNIKKTYKKNNLGEDLSKEILSNINSDTPLKIGAVVDIFKGAVQKVYPQYVTPEIQKLWEIDRADFVPSGQFLSTSIVPIEISDTLFANPYLNWKKDQQHDCISDMKKESNWVADINMERLHKELNVLFPSADPLLGFLYKSFLATTLPLKGIVSVKDLEGLWDKAFLPCNFEYLQKQYNALLAEKKLSPEKMQIAIFELKNSSLLPSKADMINAIRNSAYFKNASPLPKPTDPDSLCHATPVIIEIIEKSDKEFLKNNLSFEINQCFELKRAYTKNQKEIMFAVPKILQKGTDSIIYTGNNVGFLLYLKNTSVRIDAQNDTELTATSVFTVDIVRGDTTIKEKDVLLKELLSQKEEQEWMDTLKKDYPQASEEDLKKIMGMMKGANAPLVFIKDKVLDILQEVELSLEIQKVGGGSLAIGKVIDSWVRTKLDVSHQVPAAPNSMTIKMTFTSNFWEKGGKNVSDRVQMTCNSVLESSKHLNATTNMRLEAPKSSTTWEIVFPEAKK